MIERHSFSLKQPFLQDTTQLVEGTGASTGGLDIDSISERSLIHSRSVRPPVGAVLLDPLLRSADRLGIGRRLKRIHETSSTCEGLGGREEPVLELVLGQDDRYLAGPEILETLQPLRSEFGRAVVIGVDENEEASISRAGQRYPAEALQLAGTRECRTRTPVRPEYVHRSTGRHVSRRTPHQHGYCCYIARPLHNRSDHDRGQGEAYSGN